MHAIIIAARSYILLPGTKPNTKAPATRDTSKTSSKERMDWKDEVERRLAETMVTKVI